MLSLLLLLFAFLMAPLRALILRGDVDFDLLRAGGKNMNALTLIGPGGRRLPPCVAGDRLSAKTACGRGGGGRSGPGNHYRHGRGPRRRCQPTNYGSLRSGFRRFGSAGRTRRKIRGNFLTPCLASGNAFRANQCRRNSRSHLPGLRCGLGCRRYRLTWTGGGRRQLSRQKTGASRRCGGRSLPFGGGGSRLRWRDCCRCG